MHLISRRKRQTLAGASVALLVLLTSLTHAAQVDYDALPKEDAIVFTRGNGARQLAVFSDPYCGPCRRLEKNLAQLNDVTIYLYLFPLRKFGERRVKAVNIWCAADPAKAWRDWMFKKKSPNLIFCANPVDDLVALGLEIGVRGTPTLIHPNGQKTSGVKSVGFLDKWLGPVEQEGDEENKDVDR